MTAFWNKTTGKKESEPPKSSREADNKTSAKSKNSDKKGKKDKKADKKKLQLANPKKSLLVASTLKGLKMSEDVMRKQELGKYVFLVNKNASKQQIAEAVEAMHGKSVTKVNTINYRTREKSFRGRRGNSRGFKKAIVSLKAGQKIETV